MWMDHNRFHSFFITNVIKDDCKMYSNKMTSMRDLESVEILRYIC